MGCDIHVMMEAKICHMLSKEKSDWISCEVYKRNPTNYDEFNRISIYEDRSYDMFGLLAGVRCLDYPCISHRRGFPDDMSKETKAILIDEYDDTSYHNEGWATLQELYDNDVNGILQTLINRIIDRLTLLFDTEFIDYHTLQENTRIIFFFDN